MGITTKTIAAGGGTLSINGTPLSVTSSVNTVIDGIAVSANTPNTGPWPDNQLTVQTDVAATITVVFQEPAVSPLPSDVQTAGDARYLKVLANTSRALGSAPTSMASPPTLSVATTATLTPWIAYNDPRIKIGPGRIIDTAGGNGTGRYKSVIGLNDGVGLFSAEFTYSGQAIEFAVRSADGVRVWADGQLAAEWTGRADGTINYYKLDFGASVVRRLRVEVSGNSLWYGLKTETTAVVLPPPASPPAKLIMGYDSFTVGTNGSTGSSLLRGLALHLARRLGYELKNIAAGGTGLLNPGSGPGTLLQRWLTDNPTVDTSPCVVLLYGGYNDRASINAAYTGTALQAAIATLIPIIRATYPNAVIIGAGPQAPTGTQAAAADFTNVRDAQRAGYAAVGVPYIDQLSGNVYSADGSLLAAGVGPVTDANATAIIGTDGVHPTDNGHLLLSLMLENGVRLIIGAGIGQKA